MEVIFLSPTSLKIKAKNTSFIVNPEKKVDGEVAVFTKKPDDYSLFGDTLIFDGPGDYEVAGVSIKSEKSDDGIYFDFLEENQKLMLMSSPKIAKNEDTDDYTAVIAELSEQLDDSFSAASSEIAVVYGPEEFLPAEKGDLKKADKINLKKVEDYKGSLVYLSK